MSFLAPAAFAFAAALPVVIVFYLLKRKRVVKLVSSTLLWQKFLNETQASAPFQKLRHNWLLVFQLLLLALVIFALARPFVAGQVKSSRLRVLILDTSASMQSTDEKPSRFDKAREEALKWVDGLPAGDQMVVLKVGAQTEVLQSATSDRQALRRAVQSCQAADSTTRIAEALKLAQTLIRDRDKSDNPEIHLFSDGALPRLDEFENKDLPLVYHRIGQRGENLGLVSLDVRANPENPAERAIFTSVLNASINAQSAEIELRFGDKVLEVRSVNLPATNTTPLVFIAPQAHDGVFTVTLKQPDDLVVDNRASVVSLMPQPAKALLVSRGNRFLEKALRSQPKVQLSIAPRLTDDAAGFDLVVLDDVMPVVWPKPNTLAIHTANTNWFPAWQPLASPAIVDWKNNHPLLRFVSFDNVQIAETLSVKPPLWGVSLVDSPQTPLIVAGVIGRQRLVWVGFDTLQSTWPLRVSFPIFVANAVEWLNPASANAAQFQVRCGEPLRFTPSQSLSTAEVTKPDGTKQSMALKPDEREIIFGDTARQGVYRLKAGTNDVTFCANLLDPLESSTTPRDELPFGKYGKVMASTTTRSNKELWRWLAAIGLVVLLFEWWWYHKRTA